MVTGNIDFIGTSRPVLVVVNAKTDPIGVLGPPLIATGLTLVSCDPTTERVPDDPDEYAAVVVLGSDVNPDDDHTHDWLGAERALLRACVDRGTPTIAVCLGATSGASPRRRSSPDAHGTNRVVRADDDVQCRF